MSKTYLLKLTPTGKFFFGGDMRFGINGKDGKDEVFSSYIIESSRMPQQTSLLGMMRFLLLSNNPNLFDRMNNCIKKNVSVDGWIGKSGFSVKSDKSTNEYGKILSLGPCCVYGNGNRYYQAPLDKGFSSVNWEKPVSAVINGKEVQLPELKIMNEDKEEPFTGKHYLSSYFMAMEPACINVKEDMVHISSGNLVIKDYLYAEDELFQQDIRIGIDKDYEGKSQTNAFYKQISYRLKEGFCFAFDVEVNDDIELEQYIGQLVNLGADASTFVFEAISIENITVEDTKMSGLSVVLLSDAYISEEDMKECKVRYSINQMRPFRFLSTENKSDNSYYRINGNDAAQRSKRYELYQTGSVFYFETEEQRNKFCDVLKNRKDFNQIGYNKYYIK